MKTIIATLAVAAAMLPTMAHGQTDKQSMAQGKLHM